MSPSHSFAIRPLLHRGHSAWLQWGNSGVAGLLALSLLTVGFLAHSPEAHHEVHEHTDHHDHGAHDNHGEHTCAVTLAEHGFCDTAASPPAAGPSFTIDQPLRTASRTHAWSWPDFWQPPAQAPPGA